MESVAVSPSFWQGRRVLVTGHTGFKGPWLCHWLLSCGADVTGFALAPDTSPSLFALSGLGRAMQTIVGDVRDAHAIRAAVESTRPEVILHLAAQAIVLTSYREPVATFATNVMGTVHLLEAVRTCDAVRAIVIVTSDKCYAHAGAARPFRETDAMGGHDPYSSSKGCAELVTAAYRHSFFAASTPGVGVASARAGNVIGGGDWAADRLVPDLLRAFHEGRAATIRYPAAVRPWQHVLEPLSGYLQLAEQLTVAPAKFADGWNFGPAPRDARPVAWVAEQLAERWGAGAALHVSTAGHRHEAAMLELDCQKAREQLGWAPRLSLEDALDWTVEWHRRAQDGADARTLCLEQIARYDALRAA